MNTDVTDPAEAFDHGFDQGYQQAKEVERLHWETKVNELRAEVERLKRPDGAERTLLRRILSSGILASSQYLEVEARRVLGWTS